MCDCRIIERVGKTMLNRRRFIGGAIAAAGATGAAVPAAFTPREASATRGKRHVVDMTHTLHPDFPTYFGTPGFAKDETEISRNSDSVTFFDLRLAEHVGTHIDAPLHFAPDGRSVAEIPVEQLVAPLVVIDIAARAAEHPDAQLTPEDIKAWISRHGDIPDGACVAMHSGWAAKINTPAFRNFDGTAQHYPGFHVEAAEMLMEQTGATSIAVDTLSLDHGISPDFATHTAWLPSGRFGIENIANLDQMPPVGAMLVIGAPKYQGSSGGAARVLALV